MPDSRGDPSATVVLVHGAFRGAWCFDRVPTAVAGYDTPSLEEPVGHSPFANLPELVADLLVDLAHRSG